MPESLIQSGKCPPLLNAVTVQGAVSDLVCVQGFRTYGLQVVIGGTGSPTVLVSVLGSNDGVTVSTTAIGTWDSTTPQSSGDVVWIVDKPTQFVKLKLTTLSGGTNPTVTAYLTGV